MSYFYDGKEYQGRADFAKIRYLDPEKSLEEIKKSSFLDFVKEQNTEKAEALSRLLILSYPVDILVFKAGEILNPYRTIRIRSRCFSSYRDLGEKRLSTAPNSDAILTELVHHSCISEHRRISGYNKTDPDLYHHVKEKEKQASIDLQYSYFSLAYLLSKETGIFFEGKKYKDIFNRVYYLLKEDRNEELGSYFSRSPLLKVYSEISPEGKKVEEYLHLCEKSKESEEKLQEYLKKRRG